MSFKPLVFMGSKRAGFNALKRLLDRLPPGCIRAILCPNDVSDSRSVLAEFQALSSLYGITLHVVGGREETETILHRLSPSGVVVHGWYQLIRVREFQGTEFFGFHYSPLPQYRGNAPLVWQIINGEEEIGISFFVLSDGIDDGDLLDQRFFSLQQNEDVDDALSKADELVAVMLDDFCLKWSSGNLTRFSQSEIGASYCGMRIPEDGRIDWSQPAAVVNNFIRAQAHPYPGAYSHSSDGRKIIFLKVALEERMFYGSPGSVVEVASDAVVIACGNGSLRILQVAYEGGVKVDVKSALGSLKVRLR